MRKGEKVFVTKDGKWKGNSVEIIDYHINHKPLLYTVRDIQTGKKLAFYENELQSCFNHDMMMLEMWKEIKKGADYANR